MMMGEEPKGGTLQLDDKEIAKLNAVQAHAQKARETDIGRIGSWLGSRDNAVIYLAAGVLVFAISWLALYRFSNRRCAQTWRRLSSRLLRSRPA
jgi:hypothetical protein